MGRRSATILERDRSGLLAQGGVWPPFEVAFIRHGRRVLLVTDKPVQAVESIDTEEGLKLYWG
jgi:hypothetical protein